MYKAAGNKVFVKLEEREEKIGSLYVPEDWQKHAQVGIVLDIGGSVDVEFYKLKVGDKIMFGRYMGFDIKFDSLDKETYKVIHPDDILLIIKEEKVNA